MDDPETEPVRPASYLGSLARSAAIVSRVNTPAIADPVGENCERCGSALFRVIYDPKAMGRSVECADCHSVVLLDTGTGFLRNDDDDDGPRKKGT